jgi:hypothetical protein
LIRPRGTEERDSFLSRERPECAEFLTGVAGGR